MSSVTAVGVFVVGMHRSGTSTLVRMFEAAGFHAGTEDDFNPPTDHDPDGHREHRALWATNEAILAYIGRSWDDPVGIDWAALDPAERADVLGAINAALPAFTHTEPWVAKDPRLCLTLSLWAERVPAAAVFIHRDPLEVADSLHARDGRPLASGIALWEAYVRSALRALPLIPHTFVGFAPLVADPTAELGALLERLDLHAPRQPPISAPFTAARVRHRRSPEETAAHLNPSQRQLLTAVELLVAGHPEASDAQEAAMAAPMSAAAAELSAVPGRQLRLR